MIDINTGLIAVIIVMILVNRWREQDVLEQLRAERLEVRRDEQSRCKRQIEQSFELYKTAARHGFLDADLANEQERK